VKLRLTDLLWCFFFRSSFLFLFYLPYFLCFVTQAVNRFIQSARQSLFISVLLLSLSDVDVYLVIVCLRDLYLGRRSLFLPLRQSFYLTF